MYSTIRAFKVDNNEFQLIQERVDKRTYWTIPTAINNVCAQAEAYDHKLAYSDNNHHNVIIFSREAIVDGVYKGIEYFNIPLLIEKLNEKYPEIFTGRDTLVDIWTNTCDDNDETAPAMQITIYWGALGDKKWSTFPYFTTAELLFFTKVENSTILYWNLDGSTSEGYERFQKNVEHKVENESNS